MADIGTIRLSQDAEHPVLALAGEFDLSNSPDVVKCFDDLAAAGHTRIVVEMSETTFIDSTVLGALSLAYRRGLSLHLRGATGHVRREIDRSGLSAVFDVS